MCGTRWAILAARQSRNQRGHKSTVNGQKLEAFENPLPGTRDGPKPAIFRPKLAGEATLGLFSARDRDKIGRNWVRFGFVFWQFFHSFADSKRVSGFALLIFQLILMGGAPFFAFRTPEFLLAGCIAARIRFLIP